jgi:hypothetical protein
MYHGLNKCLAYHIKLIKKTVNCIMTKAGIICILLCTRTAPNHHRQDSSFIFILCSCIVYIARYQYLKKV